MNERKAEGLVLEQVRPERFDECADFIFEHFFPRERLAIASGLDKKPFYGARDLYKNWMSQVHFIHLISFHFLMDLVWRDRAFR